MPYTVPRRAPLAVASTRQQTGARRMENLFVMLGRLAGYAGIALTPEKVTLHINGAPILQENFQQPGTRAELRKLLATDTIVIVADLGIGDGQCTFWTSDLSNAYVDINAKYTT